MAKTLLKLLLVVVFFSASAGIGSYVVLESRSSPVAPADTPIALLDDLTNGPLAWKYPVAKFPQTGPENQQLAYSTIRDPGGIPKGLPVRLKIPTIGVDSAIEDALITPDGRMDVPVGSVNVAWFALGPKPGREGSSVIGGHFGIQNGVPFVFYRLDHLVTGDHIYVIDDKGDTLTFVVRSIRLFDRDADATTVFTSDDGLAHLNLITCEGIWNRINDTYPQRRVVFTDLVQTGDAAAAIVAYPRLLSLGSRGADVATLQTVLVQKGYLVIPRGVSKGYFGFLTRAALRSYQTSVGLPVTGILDQITRARLVSEAAVVAIKPTLPSTAIPGPETPPPSMFIESAKSLYATPKDGIITSLLLIAVVFMVIKIFRRKLII